MPFPTTDRPPPGSPLNPDSDQYDSLVACWPADEGSGRLLQDLARGNHAAVADSGFPADFGWAVSEFGPAPAIVAARLNQGWFAPTQPWYDLPKFTVCLRCQLTSKPGFDGPIKVRAAGRAGLQFVSETSGSTFTPHLTVWNSGGTEALNRQGPTAYALPMAAPHDFVWTYDGTTARLWADGVEQTTSAGAGGWGVAVDGAFIGAGYSQGVLGPIGDVRIYSAARPELGTLYHDPATRWALYRPARAAARFLARGPTSNGSMLMHL